MDDDDDHRFGIKDLLLIAHVDNDAIIVEHEYGKTAPRT